MSSSNIYGGASQLQAPAATSRPQYDLRPLSTGEVLDRTFQVYRSHFTLFAGLALLPAAVNVVTGGLRLLLAAHQAQHAQAGAAVYLAQALISLLVFISSILSLVLYGITQAATAWAVSAVYLGESATIRTAFGVAFKHWFRYTLIVWRQIWAAMWLPLVLFMAGVVLIPFSRRDPSLSWAEIALFVCAGLALIYSMWAYIRVSLAVPAAVVESLRTSPALRRSAQLLASRKIRIFLLFLLLFALYIVVGMVQWPITVLTLRFRGIHAFITQVLSLGIGFVAATLIGPIGAIGLCLFYFDERVRREGFDIEWMMKKVAPAAPADDTTPHSASIDSPQNSGEIA